MTPRPATARLLALLLVPLLVIVGTGRAQAFFLCAGDRVARTSCCCPQVEAPPGDDLVRVARARCCSTEERGAAAPVARSAEREVAPAVPIPVVVIATAPAPLRSRAASRPVDRPAHAPPRTAARASQLVALLL
jgi:hypothetical protein